MATIDPSSLKPAQETAHIENVESLQAPDINNKVIELIDSLQKKNDSIEKRLAQLEGKSNAKDVFVGAIDQGTTSSRFLIFDQRGEPIASHQVEFKQIYPHSGWHEHDPEELISSVRVCIEKATQELERKGFSKNQIQSVGITNQRETTVVWDKTTGKALHNAIVWTDIRQQALVRELKQREGADGLLDLCGLPLSTYPSATKLLWLLKNVKEVADCYEAGNLAFGTVDAWLVYKLNGGKAADVYVSDVTNSSRTMFMNIETRKYDDKLIKFFDIDTTKVLLPKIVRSSDREAFGKLSSGILKDVPIAGVLGDQSAALVGQKGFEAGQAKNTYGTGCFLLYNVGSKPVISKNGLLATIAYDFDGTPAYALEGSIAVAGQGIKFLRDNLGMINSAEEINEHAAAVDDNGGVVFVTAFSGLFAPYWVDDVRGTILGITQHTQKGHIARATMEATCFQTKAILDAMEKDSGKKLTQLAVDGGMSNSDLAMQTQADLIGIPVERPNMRETTALGAAIAAGFAYGVWKSFDDLKTVNTEGSTTFDPAMDKEQSEKMYERWEKAVKQASGFV
ncbi:glycerol kinase [Pseudovirgaria hyperparasitica]|uniref:glycerol kinase n=1 Tax=Pseudovirgaria hyperparasitica TaxID=470096 RepID=A0A6A6W3M2_9PEZI|nr:glycerol kinase [Pseudovirgaria hyperparasitica]KAF2756530.1 glycerol kinase [Pseudovirgaria hyperparasitica]